MAVNKLHLAVIGSLVIHLGVLAIALPSDKPLDKPSHTDYITISLVEPKLPEITLTPLIEEPISKPINTEPKIDLKPIVKPKHKPKAVMAVSKPSNEVAVVNTSVAENINTAVDTVPVEPAPEVKITKWQEGEKVNDFTLSLYLDSWQSKVQKVGQFNYPKNETGKVKLQVILNSDGTIDSIEVLQASESDLINQKAIEIVKAASPYSKFPDAMKEKMDKLQIVRTWVFKTVG